MPILGKLLVCMMRPLDRAVGEIFALPDRHYALELVDQKSACLERLVSMCRRNCDDDTTLPNRYGAYAMHHRHFLELPRLPRLLDNLVHHLQRHRLIGFVFQNCNRSAMRVIPCRSNEDINSPRLRHHHRGDNFLQIYWRLCYGYHYFFLPQISLRGFINLEGLYRDSSLIPHSQAE